MYNTNHQKEIQALFTEHQEKTYTAVGLVEMFKGQIDKATIYRKLKALESEQVIRKINKNDGSICYQYACHCSNHLHLICQNCNKTIHLSCDKANDFVNHILKSHGFSINQNNTLIYGLCGDCK